MSFSSNVKSELSHHFGNARHCNIAELAAILNMCGHIACNQGNFCVKIQTENPAAARKYFTLLKKTFNIDCEVLTRRNSQLKKNMVYMLFINGSEQAHGMLMACGLLRYDNGKVVISKRVDELLVNSVCCKRAYIRGAFLASGSITDPEKMYHLEFACSEEAYSNSLRDLINSFGLEAKIVKRKEHYIVYLKEGEQIVDLLNIMEAHKALLDLENIRILKDMRNNVNRKVNCETANINKTVNAAVRQIEDIEFILERMDLSQLPQSLREIAHLRLDYPEASLKELGQLLCPSVGKSGVNHRLRKLSDIADSLREEMGEGFGTQNN
ncbi:putative sporulation transcription regulator WhiA [Clostridiales bacterium]|nr:putative sporulation transcription regulator WhiA [Clostridiales bacterium]